MTRISIADAFQAGADYQLEACIKALEDYCGCGVELLDIDIRELLHELCRPKPSTDPLPASVASDSECIDGASVVNEHATPPPESPSLKEQALEALNSFEGFTGSLEEVFIIRCALEALPND